MVRQVPRAGRLQLGILDKLLRQSGRRAEGEIVTADRSLFEQPLADPAKVTDREVPPFDWGDFERSFVDLVSRMRAAQRSYFKTRARRELELSKRLEYLVDSVTRIHEARRRSDC